MTGCRNFRITKTGVNPDALRALAGTKMTITETKEGLIASCKRPVTTAVASRILRIESAHLVAEDAPVAAAMEVVLAPEPGHTIEEQVKRAVNARLEEVSATLQKLLETDEDGRMAQVAELTRQVVELNGRLEQHGRSCRALQTRLDGDVEDRITDLEMEQSQFESYTSELFETLVQRVNAHGMIIDHKNAEREGYVAQPLRNFFRSVIGLSPLAANPAKKQKRS